jgi:hypothetical protein
MYSEQKWFSIVKALKEKNLDPAVNDGKNDHNKQNTFLAQVWQMDY